MAGLSQLMLLRCGMPCSQQCWSAQHQNRGRTLMVLGAGDSHPEAPRQRKPHAQCKTGCPVLPSVPRALPATHSSRGSHLPAHS